jgi:hypothetical protein
MKEEINVIRYCIKLHPDEQLWISSLFQKLILKIISLFFFRKSYYNWIQIAETDIETWDLTLESIVLAVPIFPYLNFLNLYPVILLKFGMAKLQI